MLTTRDLEVGTAAVNQIIGGVKLPIGLDQKIAAAVITAVDKARSPVVVGSDILSNLLRPHSS